MMMVIVMVMVVEMLMMMMFSKVTGTLVTLKRLASVQEQRIHPGAPIGHRHHHSQ